MHRFTICLTILLAFCLSAAAAGVGLTYDEFVECYTENVLFINANTGRHLLPHTLQRDYDADAKRFYHVQSGALSMEMHMEESGTQIASCTITLTAPDGMSYGDALYNDFTTSGYHSYAMLMALSPASTPAERYALVEEVNTGLAQNEGSYETYAGDYRLTCTNAGNTVTLLLENELFIRTFAEEEPGETAQPEVEIVDTENNEEISKAG